MLTSLSISHQKNTCNFHITDLSNIIKPGYPTSTLFLLFPASIYHHSMRILNHLLFDYLMLIRLSRDFHRSYALLKAHDFYKILGVKKSAKETDIKKAYFDLAKRLHPDVNKSSDAKERFSEVSTAYETLGDKTKRHIYDKTGLNADDQLNNDAYTENFEDGSEYFAQQDESLKIKGEDVKISIEIGFLDSVNGCSKSVNYDRLDTCPSCKGTKAKSGTSPVRCTVCSGYGILLDQRGPVAVQVMCDKCQGTGTTIKHPCPPCKGKGYSTVKCTENLKVPAGVANGFTMKVSSKGSISTSRGKTGDLLVILHVKDHPVLRRTGFDIYSTVKLPMGLAALGGAVTVETLHGKLEILVQPGLNNSENLRISNYGVPHLPPNSAQRGHHFVELQVQIPKKLNLKQKSILEQLAEIENNNY